jgi:hypothetical protein
MLYPMVQSAVLIFVEKVKNKGTARGHCPWSSWCSSLIENHFGALAGSYQNRNETWKVTLRAPFVSHQ